MAIVRADIINYIKTHFGFPLVEVELSEGTVPDDAEDQFGQFIKSALRTYARWRPLIRVGYLSSSPNVARYDLTALSKPFGLQVVDVRAPISPAGPMSFDSSLLGLPGNVLPVGRGGDGLGNYLAAQLETENARRAMAADFDWEFRIELVSSTDHGVLYLSPLPTGRTYEYEYALVPTLAQIPAIDEDWILDYTTALARIALGQARRKWEGELSMDGTALVNEGMQAKKELETTIKQRGTKRYMAPRQ